MKQLDAGLTTGNGNTVKWKQGEGRIGHVVIGGTFDTADVDVQMSPDDGTTWVGVDGAMNITEPTHVTLHLPFEADVRVSIQSGGGGSTSLNTWWGVSIT